MKRKEIFSIPNIISYIRIALMPVYVYSSLTADCKEEYMMSSFLLLFIAITDFLDGYIARKYNMVTELGKLMDPIADKLFQLAIALCLMYKVPGMWVVFIVFMIKETILGICNIYFWFRHHRKMDGAMWCGKVSTTIFYSMTFIMALLPPLPELVYYLMEILMVMGLLYAFVNYGRFFMNLQKEIHTHENEKNSSL